MTRFAIIVIAAVALVLPLAASAQPPGVKDKMKELLDLEREGQHRKAYLGWQMLLKTPALANNLANEDIRKIYFECYFCSARTLYKTGQFDPAAKDRQKIIAAVANMILKLEFSKSQEGWQSVGPMFRALLKDEEPLRLEYQRLKTDKEKN
jgi:hypothetical protein